MKAWLPLGVAVVATVVLAVVVSQAASVQGKREAAASLRLNHGYAVAMATSADFLGEPVKAVPTTPDHLAIGVEEAQAGVRAQMRDGESARWGAIWTVDGWNYCGFVNGKNAYGAYAGFKPFRAVGDQAEISPSAETWNRYCRGLDPKIALDGRPGPADKPA
jgi:hypothetical protein